MDDEVKKRLDVQYTLLLKIYTSVEKTRKYFLWTLIMTLVVFILPIIGLVFVIPTFLDTYTSALRGL